MSDNNTDFLFLYNIYDILKVIAKESCEKQPFSLVMTFYVIAICHLHCQAGLYGLPSDLQHESLICCIAGFYI